MRHLVQHLTARNVIALLHGALRPKRSLVQYILHWPLSGVPPQPPCSVLRCTTYGGLSSPPVSYHRYHTYEIHFLSSETNPIKVGWFLWTRSIPIDHPLLRTYRLPSHHAEVLIASYHYYTPTTANEFYPLGTNTRIIPAKRLTCWDSSKGSYNIQKNTQNAQFPLKLLHQFTTDLAGFWHFFTKIIKF